MSFYWITRLDALVLASSIMALLFGFILFVFFIFCLAEGESVNNRLNRTIGVCFLFFLLAAVFTPTTEQACAIYFVDYLQENKDARELPDKVIKSANIYLDKLIKEMEQEEQEKKEGVTYECI